MEGAEGIEAGAPELADPIGLAQGAEHRQAGACADIGADPDPDAD